MKRDAGPANADEQGAENGDPLNGGPHGVEAASARDAPMENRRKQA